MPVHFLFLLQRFRGSETILSGGSINSPQLLMLSGIGNADHLKEVIGLIHLKEIPSR